MDKLINAIHKGILKGINEHNINMLADIDDDITDNNIAVKDINSKTNVNTLYNNYVARDGKTEADTYSARPGHSEHQTALAIDVYNKTKSYLEFENTKEFIWMHENAHKYGFIIRFPKGKEHITGYKYEPWHIRYIGVDHATAIYNQQITLEEYLNIA